MRQGRKKKNNGFTLIELLVSITLVTFITASLYFCINSAIESWTYSRDQLGMQKVLSETMDRMISGGPESYGLKDSLEILLAEKGRMEFVTPWTDDTHAVANLGFIYSLNRSVKPGSGVPIAQIQLPESADWQAVPAVIVDLENSDTSQIKLKLAAPENSQLRFIYQPDPVTNPDVVKKIYWDAGAKEVFFEDESKQQGVESISKNLFGVEITKMELHYFSNANHLVTDRESVDEAGLPIITGIEVHLEASLNGKKQDLTSFVSLRNAPMRKGYLFLAKNLRVFVPDSKHIHTIMLTNFAGISNNDKVQLDIIPESGSTTWRLTAQFEKIGSAKPIVKQITVEYPPQTVVFTDYPKSNAELGLNLNLLDSEGLYDYDDDNDVDDMVMLDGKVELVVREMDIKGAGLFVRP